MYDYLHKVTLLLQPAFDFVKRSHISDQNWYLSINFRPCQTKATVTIAKMWSKTVQKDGVFYSLPI